VRISSAFAAARTVALSLAAIALLLGLAWVIYHESTTPIVYVSPFEVPESISKMGYSGSVLARRLTDNLTHIQLKANTSMEKQRISSGLRSGVLDFQVLATGISFNNLVQYLQTNVVGSASNIAGELVARGDRVLITVRVAGREPKTTEGPLKAIDQLLLSAAEHIARDIEPVVLANYLYETKRTEQALDAIRFAIHTPPRSDDGRAYSLWGWILTDSKNFAGAVSKFQQAAMRDPKAAHPHVGLCWTLGELAKRDQAAMACQKAAELNPRDVSALNNWSVALLRQGRLDEAIKRAKQVLEIDAEEAAAYYNWGIALAQQNQYEEAVSKFEVGFEIHDHDIAGDQFMKRDYGGLHEWWSYALIMLKRYEEAVQKCEWVISRDLANERVYAYKGVALLEMGKAAEAVAVLEKAVQLGATDVVVQDALSRARLANRDAR
jgi:tetratricopeptide (TPR) repeat protein